MGNCCSDNVGRPLAVVGSAAAAASDTLPPSADTLGLYPQIELSLSASDLRDQDELSKSDYLAVVYEKKRDGRLEELGRTEVVFNSLNPVWITKHTITYQFEVVQPLVFRVYDIDREFHNVPLEIIKLDEQQFLGEDSCTLSEILTKSTRSLTLNLEHREHRGAPPRNVGQLTVHAEECIASKHMVEMILRCSDLETKDLFSKCELFLVISRTMETGDPIPLCKTEVRKDDLNPTWRPLFLNIQQVKSKDSPLIIDCFNFINTGKHYLIGTVHKSLADLENVHNSQHGENLFLPTLVGQNIDNKVLQGQLFVDKYSETLQNTFLDYIASGWELNFMVAIDFTASNGNPRLPDSLHYMDPSGRPNAYQKAILEAAEVLQVYDSDKCFPAWGFGARPIDGPISHCFNLNGSNDHSKVEGLQGIMSAYMSALQNVSLAGPTLFERVINNASLIARQSQLNSQQKYFVLLIITDGVITDLQETRDALVEASDLPLSVLIVGVGGADFKEMEFLDSAKGERLESSTGQVASRDTVQFVPMRTIQSGEISSIQSLLAELPSQFLSYMRIRDIQQHK